MKQRIGLVKKAAAILLGLMMSLTCMITANAAAVPDLDLSKTGTIEMTLMDADGVTVSDGVITIYEVAKLYLDDGNMAYELTDSFSDCTVALDVTDTTLAASLVSYMSGRSIAGTTQNIASDGSVSFTGLELGLYLVVQTTASSDYETISPFVVTLPMDENGEWIYTVNASPKVGTVTLIEEEPEPETPEEEETSDPEPTEAPSTSDPILPQTGQLTWPIPILLIGGFVLLIAGYILKNSGKTNKRYAS